LIFEVILVDRKEEEAIDLVACIRRWLLGGREKRRTAGGGGDVG
jgi:hypothetical protein